MSYPKFIIDKKKLKNNAKNALEMCNNLGIETVGVVKAVNGLDKVIEILIEAGFKTLASSRLSQLKKLKKSIRIFLHMICVSQCLVKLRN